MATVSLLLTETLAGLFRQFTNKIIHAAAPNDLKGRMQSIVQEVRFCLDFCNGSCLDDLSEGGPSKSIIRNRVKLLSVINLHYIDLLQIVILIRQMIYRLILLRSDLIYPLG